MCVLLLSLIISFHFSCFAISQNARLPINSPLALSGGAPNATCAQSRSLAPALSSSFPSFLFSPFLLFLLSLPLSHPLFHFPAAPSLASPSLREPTAWNNLVRGWYPGNWVIPFGAPTFSQRESLTTIVLDQHLNIYKSVASVSISQLVMVWRVLKLYLWCLEERNQTSESWLVEPS